MNFAKFSRIVNPSDFMAKLIPANEILNFLRHFDYLHRFTFLKEFLLIDFDLKIQFVRCLWA